MRLRSILEKLSRGRVVSRRLPARFGGRRIYVSPDAALSYWKLDLSSVCADLFKFAADYVRPGDAVWDVGSCMGVFAFAAASVAGPTGKVVAIEPDPFNLDVLRRTARETDVGAAPVEILPVAASDKVDVADLLIAERGRSADHLASFNGSSQSGGVRQVVKVVTVTLDWLQERFRPPRVMKMDVEGAELAVLRGAVRVLSEARPAVLCEVYERQAGEVSLLLHEHGYRLFDFARRSEGQIERATYNTLALPPDWE